MSRMSAHGYRVIALGACLVGLAAGCQSLSTTAQRTPPDRASEQSEYDGWLFKKITGQENASSESRRVDPEVRQASAIEPVVPVDPLAPGGVAPGAGVVASAAPPAKAKRDLERRHKAYDLEHGNPPPPSPG